MMKDPNPIFSRLFSSLMFGDCFGGLVFFGILSVILMSWWWVLITFALWIFLLCFASLGSAFLFRLEQKRAAMEVTRRGRGDSEE